MSSPDNELLLVSKDSLAFRLTPRNDPRHLHRAPAPHLTSSYAPYLPHQVGPADVYVLPGARERHVGGDQYHSLEGGKLIDGEPAPHLPHPLLLLQQMTRPPARLEAHRLDTLVASMPSLLDGLAQRDGDGGLASAAANALFSAQLARLPADARSAASSAAADRGAEILKASPFSRASMRALLTHPAMHSPSSSSSSCWPWAGTRRKTVAREGKSTFGKEIGGRGRKRRPSFR